MPTDGDSAPQGRDVGGMVMAVVFIGLAFRRGSGGPGHDAWGAGQGPVRHLTIRMVRRRMITALGHLYSVWLY